MATARKDFRGRVLRKGEVQRASDKRYMYCYTDPFGPVSYTHLRAHETKANLVCRLLLEKKKKKNRAHETKVNT